MIKNYISNKGALTPPPDIEVEPHTTGADLVSDPTTLRSVVKVVGS